MNITLSQTPWNPTTAPKPEHVQPRDDFRPVVSVAVGAKPRMGNAKTEAPNEEWVAIAMKERAKAEAHAWANIYGSQQARNRVQTELTEEQRAKHDAQVIEAIRAGASTSVAVQRATRITEHHTYSTLARLRISGRINAVRNEVANGPWRYSLPE